MRNGRLHKIPDTLVVEAADRWQCKQLGITQDKHGFDAPDKDCCGGTWAGDCGGISYGMWGMGWLAHCGK